MICLCADIVKHGKLVLDIELSIGSKLVGELTLWSFLTPQWLDISAQLCFSFTLPSLTRLCYLLDSTFSLGVTVTGS